MNERIRKLAEQAEWRFADKATGNFSEHDKRLEKFAQLIVRECAGLAVNSQYANTKSEYYEGFNEALVYVGNKFKQHFGVEE